MTFDLFDAVQPAVETDRNARSGNAALSQFFTPFWVAEELVHDALRNLGTDIHIAEPSCGTGAFLAAIPKTCPAFGVVIDPAVIPAALANSGRDVLLGAFRHIDLGQRTDEATVDNPHFTMALIADFL